MAIRPTPPDSDSVENLAVKVRLAASAGIGRLDFYHYGLMRLDALARIARRARDSQSSSLTPFASPRRRREIALTGSHP